MDGKGNRTDPEIAYWVPKYLLLRGCSPFSSLGAMSPAILRLARCQDEIGWREMLEGMISKEFREIQTAHCMVAPCAMNGDDWVKQFTAKLLQISYSQWIYRNFTLHERRRGLLALKAREQVLTDIRNLMDTDPEEVPAASRYLLELDFSHLADSVNEDQAYWVVAVKAAKVAGQRAWQRLRRMGGSAKRHARKTAHRRKVARGVYAVETVLATIRRELGLEKDPSRRRRAEGAIPATRRPQKRVKRPE